MGRIDPKLIDKNREHLVGACWCLELKQALATPEFGVEVEDDD